ncbi:protein kinase-like domain, concanavalin A-like lectin/glucanase domain protein [Tanacetum coccineum]
MSMLVQRHKIARRLEVESWLKNSRSVDLLVSSDDELEDEIEEVKEEEEDDLEYFDIFPTMRELGYHEWLLKNPRHSWVKAKIRTGSLNNIKISLHDWSLSKKQAYINLESPINVMSKLHYNWMMSNRLESRRKSKNPRKISNYVGRVRGLKVFIGNFTYKFNFMVLEDTTSVIDHYLGSVLFGKPFVKKTRLIYDKEEGTVLFEKDNENIIFKMPCKMEIFKHIDFKDIKTDRIPPFVIEGDDDSHEKTHYSDSLNLGPEYKYDESVSKAIQGLMKLKSVRDKVRVT